jgi:hypothetical protein
MDGKTKGCIVTSNGMICAAADIFFNSEPIMTVYTLAGVLLAISIVGALMLVSNNRSLDQRVTKILMFGLYFWVLTFAQAIVYSLIYQIWIK